MSMFTVRKAVAGIALFTGATLTMATAASADSISKAPKLSRRQLASACAANGGGSYGGSGAWGCTKNHDDGSADTIECTRAGCKHYHYDPARVAPTGGRVAVLRPVGAVAMR